jgi:uncharacterized protein (TIGR00106 family)
MLAIFSTFPTDKGDSISGEVAEVIEIIIKSGLPYQTTAMGTIVEGEWDQVMELVKNCHCKLREKSRRVYTKISIDDREGANGRLTGKIDSIEKKLGRKVNR